MSTFSSNTAAKRLITSKPLKTRVTSPRPQAQAMSTFKGITNKAVWMLFPTVWVTVWAQLAVNCQHDWGVVHIRQREENEAHKRLGQVNGAGEGVDAVHRVVDVEVEKRCAPCEEHDGSEQMKTGLIFIRHTLAAAAVCLRGW
ncbi:hypothetical protein J3459_006102 [Metarhizium acridum]|nr:hypothetical protein J3459_006102 [Metarhizium acridum]